jgi:AcrR family transcriptional regulator
MAETKSETRHQTRASIVEVAARLLREQGPQAVTIRAVAQAAGLQAPTIYRFFEDKDALLDAVAEHVFATYVERKSVAHDGDPVADLRAGWAVHIDFGLANPAVFGLLTDPQRRGHSPAAAAGVDVLRRRVRRVAEAGRLRVEEQRAVELVHSAGTGVLLTLLSVAPEDRDPALADAMYDAITRAILLDAPDPEPVGFRATAAALPMLTGAERALLSEWLERQ